MKKGKEITLRVLASICNFSALAILFIGSHLGHEIAWFYICALGVYGTILFLEAGRLERERTNEDVYDASKSLCFISLFAVWCVPVMYAWGFTAITVSTVFGILIYVAIPVTIVRGLIAFIRFVYKSIRKEKIKSPKEIEIDRILYNEQYFYREKGLCLCPNCKATLRKESGCVCSCGFDLYLGRVENPFDRLTRPLRNNRKGVVRVLTTLLFLLLCGVTPFICYILSERYVYFFPFLAGVLVTSLVVELALAIKRL